jgi:hypothetical protein
MKKQLTIKGSVRVKLPKKFSLAKGICVVLYTHRKQNFATIAALPMVRQT